MKLTIKALACIISTLSIDSHAMMEIPFCPAGGPPGWINYFNYKRDQNHWQHQYYYQPNYPAANYGQPYHYPANIRHMNYGARPTVQSNNGRNYHPLPTQNFYDR